VLRNKQPNFTTAKSQRAHVPKRQELLLLLLSMIHDVSLVWARLIECNVSSVVQVLLHFGSASRKAARQAIWQGRSTQLELLQHSETMTGMSYFCKWQFGGLDFSSGTRLVHLVILDDHT
jgi:hypothetical protein